MINDIIGCLKRALVKVGAPRARSPKHTHCFVTFAQKDKKQDHRKRCKACKYFVAISFFQNVLAAATMATAWSFSSIDVLT